MIPPTFVQEYAAPARKLKPKISTGSALSESQVPALLALVQLDGFSFAAAVWYYNTHCTDSQWWPEQQTGVNDQRVQYWANGFLALGVPVKE
ncbi:uncharacterized protein Z519_08761 [Cladophialophora bantiana CBS 173.52]|uniref:Uncharacterized protein n=1 Tax=Cladophialophora bantiana (strain ATCC 10958 / CBS 173.52 / CDC B-1940 / NIH 8579) TaxID=1442370 RepID=A0A0D2HCK4_CLAB1|nr:uncharacterized protein Z519_08761 [Cladophialophora bantiana CBS 173.52]KIW90978.1 hypothetical protein Z519_08761 [Cladophialophora bantiana CBS 173.52]